MHTQAFCSVYTQKVKKIPLISLGGTFSHICYHRKVNLIPHMSHITTTEIEKLANLSRIKISDEEKVTFANQIGSILEYVNQIKEVVSDTKRSIVKESYPHRNSMREDVANRDVLKDPQVLVESAPASQNGFVKVKKILN